MLKNSAKTACCDLLEGLMSQLACSGCSQTLSTVPYYAPCGHLLCISCVNQLTDQRRAGGEESAVEEGIDGTESRTGAGSRQRRRRQSTRSRASSRRSSSTSASRGSRYGAESDMEIDNDRQCPSCNSTFQLRQLHQLPKFAEVMAAVNTLVSAVRDDLGISIALTAAAEPVARLPLPPPAAAAAAATAATGSSTRSRPDIERPQRKRPLALDEDSSDGTGTSLDVSKSTEQRAGDDVSPGQQRRKISRLQLLAAPDEVHGSEPPSPEPNPPPQQQQKQQQQQQQQQQEQLPKSDLFPSSQITVPDGQTHPPMDTQKLMELNRLFEEIDQEVADMTRPTDIDSANDPLPQPDELSDFADGVSAIESVSSSDDDEVEHAKKRARRPRPRPVVIGSELACSPPPYPPLQPPLQMPKLQSPPSFGIREPSADQYESVIQLDDNPDGDEDDDNDDNNDEREDLESGSESEANGTTPVIPESDLLPSNENTIDRRLNEATEEDPHQLFSSLPPQPSASRPGTTHHTIHERSASHVLNSRPMQALNDDWNHTFGGVRRANSMLTGEDVSAFGASLVPVLQSHGSLLANEIHQSDIDNDSDAENDDSDGGAGSPDIGAVHPTSTLPQFQDRNMVILATGLNTARLRKLQSAVDMFNSLNVPTDPVTIAQDFSESVTHIVTSTTSTRIAAKRTSKYLLGILSGCWIVSFDWVSESMASWTTPSAVPSSLLSVGSGVGPSFPSQRPVSAVPQRLSSSIKSSSLLASKQSATSTPRRRVQWLDESLYEVMGDDRFLVPGAPRRARERRMRFGPRLFLGRTFILAGPFSSEPPALGIGGDVREIAQLIETGGGRVVVTEDAGGSTDWKSGLGDFPDGQQWTPNSIGLSWLIICTGAGDSSKQLPPPSVTDLVKRYNWPMVDSSWLFNCISASSIFDISEYTVTANQHFSAPAAPHHHTYPLQ
ncbi:hypothetical protein GQ42DRAFT_12970 [Ramicandelaber brevisporus]|nr:hypothetical protein GQ42DRAFT_12970 [Ramicandelaber brevisporus]